MKIELLSKEIADSLAEYGDEVYEEIKRACEAQTKLALEEVKEKSPVSTGSYQRGWRVKKEFENGKSIRFRIHNKTDYSLTHLLEYGHVKVNGGRVEGKPHIGPAAQRAQSNLEREVEGALKR